LILDISLQPAELDDRYGYGHDEQDDGLGAGQAVAAELERGAVDQLNDRDRGVVRAAAVGHDVDALEDLEGQDRVHDHQIERGRAQQGDGDVAPPGVPVGAFYICRFVQFFGDAADGG